MSIGTQRKRHPRLVQLIALGQGNETVETLAAKLGVSEKTVRRDISGLRLLGITIEEHICQNGRKTYDLPDDAIRKVGFTYDEAYSLMLCRPGTDGFNGTLIGDASQSAFDKICTAMGDCHGDSFDRISPLLHRSSGYGDYRDQRDVIDAVTLGIEDSKAITIAYRSARSTEPVTYDIHPYGLAEHNGALYVVGHSCHHGEIRTWKIDRMESAEVTQSSFIRPADFNLSKQLAGAFAVIAGSDPVTVQIRFHGTAARYASERKINATQTETPGPGGSLDVSITLSSTIEIKSYILSFGSAAEVLAPESLRKKVAQELQQAIANYSNQSPVQTVNTASPRL